MASRIGRWNTMCSPVQIESNPSSSTAWKCSVGHQTPPQVMPTLAIYARGLARLDAVVGDLLGVDLDPEPRLVVREQRAVAVDERLRRRRRR